jgi:hypothetical protein
MAIPVPLRKADAAIVVFPAGLLQKAPSLGLLRPGVIDYLKTTPGCGICLHHRMDRFLLAQQDFLKVDLVT